MANTRRMPDSAAMSSHGYESPVEQNDEAAFHSLALGSPSNVGLSFSNDPLVGCRDRGDHRHIRDTYSLSSSGTILRQQSLLPPFPENLAYSNMSLTEQSFLRRSPESKAFMRPGGHPSLGLIAAPQPERTVLNQELSIRRQPALPSKVIDNQLSSAAAGPGRVKSAAISVTSCSSVETCSTSSLNHSNILSASTTLDSAWSTPTSNDSLLEKEDKTPKSAAVIQSGHVVPARHGRSISLSPETKRVSIGDTHPDSLDINYCDSKFSATPCSKQTVPSPSAVQIAEVSAFDFDSDEEGTASASKALRKMVSRPRLHPLRSRADTVPSAPSTRNFSKPSPAPDSGSEQDAKAYRRQRNEAFCTGVGIRNVSLLPSSSPSDRFPRNRPRAAGPVGLTLPLAHKIPHGVDPPSEPHQGQKATLPIPSRHYKTCRMFPPRDQSPLQTPSLLAPPSRRLPNKKLASPQRDLASAAYDSKTASERSNGPPAACVVPSYATIITAETVRKRKGQPKQRLRKLCVRFLGKETNPTLERL